MLLLLSSCLLRHLLHRLLSSCHLLSSSTFCCIRPTPSSQGRLLHCLVGLGVLGNLVGKHLLYWAHQALESAAAHRQAFAPAAERWKGMQAGQGCKAMIGQGFQRLWCA
jgi:hypothetical protein